MHVKKALLPEYVFYLICLVFVLFIRIRFCDMAMERDEGEYAYAGAEILRGGFPYLDFYNMKLPGVYYAYATVFFLFGKSVKAIRLCVLGLNILNSLFIRKINERWFDERAGWLAAGIYLIASMGTNSQGVVSNCEHFVIFFFLLSLFSLTRLRYFMAGLSAALCILMKQQGGILVVFTFIYGCFEVYKNRENTSIFKIFLSATSGFCLPFALFFIGIWLKNAFPSFTYFALDYAHHYVGEKEAKPFDFTALEYVINQYLWFWKEAVMGSLIAFSYLFFRKKSFFSTPYTPFLLVILGFISYLSILPGWYFRQHYFQYIHPAVAMLAGYFLTWFYSVCYDKALKMAYILLLALSLSTAIYALFPVMGVLNTREFINFLYGYDSFNEMREIGRVIKLNAQADDKIGQVGNEPEVCFYADLKAASGYLYNYPFYEKQPYSAQMMEQFFKEMEASKPRWYIKSLNKEKWFNDHEQKMTDWSQQFEKAYTLRGVVYTQNEWIKTVEWKAITSDSLKGWERSFLIFERGDSASLKPLRL